jgi:hypothetical protein
VESVLAWARERLLQSKRKAHRLRLEVVKYPLLALRQDSRLVSLNLWFSLHPKRFVRQ